MTTVSLPTVRDRLHRHELRLALLALPLIAVAGVSIWLFGFREYHEHHMTASEWALVVVGLAYAAGWMAARRFRCPQCGGRFLDPFARGALPPTCPGCGIAFDSECPCAKAPAAR